MISAFALAILATPQAPPSAADLADAKCIAAMAALGEAADDGDKSGLQSVMMFYLGKIVGRSGSAALAPALEAAVPQLKAAGDEVTATTAETCANETEKATAAM